MASEARSVVGTIIRSTEDRPITEAIKMAAIISNAIFVLLSTVNFDADLYWRFKVQEKNGISNLSKKQYDQEQDVILYRDKKTKNQMRLPREKTQATEQHTLIQPPIQQNY